MTSTTLVNEVLKGFKIKAKCINVSQNRHFSFYDLELDRGTKINKISQYSAELALAMRTKTPFTIATIPEKGIVRMHTTHENAKSFNLNDIINVMPAPTDFLLPFLLGETAEGKPLWVDMSKNPHLLIAGSTGSGKSVLLHNIIANAAKRNDVNLFLIDTKRVEFNIYNNDAFEGLVWNVSDNYENALASLFCVHNMMESRYNFMAKAGIQSIEQAPHMFSKVMVIIDEAADLMLFNRTKEFENIIVKLAQKARAAGIYLILATQRPSVDVITGLIKGIFPARISCKVSTKTDSRVVMDHHGAENLAGRGDAIMRLPTSDGPVRFQVAYVDPTDTLKSMV